MSLPPCRRQSHQGRLAATAHATRSSRRYRRAILAAFARRRPVLGCLPRGDQAVLLHAARALARAASALGIGRGCSRPGSARLGLQKGGLPSCRGGSAFSRRFKAINSRTEEGAALVAAPFKSGQEWTPRRAILLCSPPCRCSAQASPGFWIT